VASERSVAGSLARRIEGDAGQATEQAPPTSTQRLPARGQEADELVALGCKTARDECGIDAEAPGVRHRNAALERRGNEPGAGSEMPGRPASERARSARRSEAAASAPRSAQPHCARDRNAGAPGSRAASSRRRPRVTRVLAEDEVGLGELAEHAQRDVLRDCRSASRRPRALAAPSSNTCRLLARDHARQSPPSSAKTASRGRERVRPLACARDPELDRITGRSAPVIGIVVGDERRAITPAAVPSSARTISTRSPAGARRLTPHVSGPAEQEVGLRGKATADDDELGEMFTKLPMRGPSIRRSRRGSRSRSIPSAARRTSRWRVYAGRRLPASFARPFR